MKTSNNTAMKFIIKLFGIGVLLFFLVACGEDRPKENHAKTDTEEKNHHADEAHHEEGLVSLTKMQRNTIGLTLGQVEQKNISSSIRVTGNLEVPPQGKASISALMGGNIHQIMVIESDEVNRGQTLALVENPEFIQMQVDLRASISQLDFLHKKYQRQQNLYEKQVGSGKAVQQAKAEYLAKKAQVEGLKAKLKMLHINPKSVIDGKIYAYLPIISPIKGFVKAVNINLGQYVGPKKTLFEVIDDDHIHVDLMVFEKDIDLVEKGQIIDLEIANSPQKDYQAKIFSVGKFFEQDPKAVHIHAEIIGETNSLISGMYVQGIINNGQNTVNALPQTAVIKEGNKSFIFVKVKDTTKTEEWTFKKITIETGQKDGKWVEVKFFQPHKDVLKVVYTGAYKLISEMKKSEMAHHH